MKKRVLSMLLAFILCFSTLPMTAFAQEADAVTEQAGPAAEQEEQQEEQQAAVPAAGQEEAEAAAAPGAETPADKSTTAAAPGTEDSTVGEATDTVKPTGESVSGSDVGTQDTAENGEKDAEVQAVQKLIDALPETVTVENAESIGEQLAAIDEAMESLTEEQIAELDMEHLYAISEAMSAPMTVAEGEHRHPVCGETCTDGDEHEAVTWTPISKLTNEMEAGNYYLTDDIILTAEDTKYGNWKTEKDINLCLNGHTITLTDNQIMIWKKLSLCNCSTETKEVSCNSGITITDDGEFQLYDNVQITSPQRNGVIIHSGKFIMYGGTISGCSEMAVHIGSSATFEMKGGEIRNNSSSLAYRGGGVNVNGTFIVSGTAKITGNTANGAASNVYLQSGAKMIVGDAGLKDGASIGVTLNKYPNDGGAVTIATGKVEGSSKYFSVDAGSPYGVMEQDGELVLKNGVPHIHPVCGATCTDDDHHDSVEWTGISSLDQITENGYYYLKNDIPLSSTWTITDKKVNLCLNGHSITNTKGDYALNIGNSAVLSLCNPHDKEAICGGVKVAAGGTFNLYDKVQITKSWPCGVMVETGGTFIMNGGTICNNHSGVNLYGTLIMNGGSISNNTGINNTRINFGGGVWVDCHGNFTMNGGEISGNTAELYGGGVYVESSTENHKSGTLTVSGNVKISGNKADGFKDNVALCEGSKITIAESGLGSNASIGVRLAYDLAEGNYAVIASGVDSSYADKITSDSGARTTKQVDDELLLYSRSTRLHTHLICGKNCTHTGGDAHGTLIWQGISSLDEIKEAGNYYLKNDISLSKVWEVPYDINLCLNGHQIKNTAGSNYRGYLIHMENKKLSLCNCDTTRVDESVLNGGVSMRGSDSQLDLYRNVKISNSIDTTWGNKSVVWVYGGKFTMHGGTVSGDNKYAGIHVTSEGTCGGTFVMKDGTITGNSGAGVTVSGGSTVIMDGGTITGNVSGSNGGGVYVGYGTFTMNGGTISGNTSYSNGGGVYVNDASSKFIMNGGTISNNKTTIRPGYSKPSSGGGVYVGYGKFIMNDGTIENNEAESFGGGIVVAKKGSFDMNGGTITDNKCTSLGSGVYLESNGTFTMKGGSITKNRTKYYTYAGGVYVAEGSKLALSGTVNITENTRDYGGRNMAENVYLQGEAENPTTITIGAGLSEDSRIGVSKAEYTIYGGKKIKIATGAETGVDYTKIFTADATSAEYLVTKDDEGNVYLGTHQHSWVYTAKDATIKLECSECKESGGSVKVNAPSDQVYNGGAHKAYVTASTDWQGTAVDKITISYESEENGEVTPCDTPRDSGTYCAKITVDGVTAMVKYDIAKKTILPGDLAFYPPQNLEYGAGTYEVSFKYDRNLEIGDITVRYYDESHKKVDNVRDVGRYTVEIDIAESKNFEAAKNLGWNYADSWTFTILPATLTVTPTAGQSKTYGDLDPEAFDYEVSGKKYDDKPVFTGTLGREEGNDAGTYAITLGTLKLTDGANFQAKNYTLELAKTTVDFTINPKTLHRSDLKVNGSSITKVYDGTKDVKGLEVVVDSDALVAGDQGIKVTGTAVYNSANVADAKSVIFTPDPITTGNYRLEATEQLEVSGTLAVAITPATITVTPESGKTKTYGAKDPELGYTHSGAIGDETPLFTGALGREIGEDVSSYVINKGTLALMDNSDGNFQAGNYTLKLSDTPVDFVITKATPVITMPDRTLVKNGVAVDITNWASFNNTDAGAKLTYTLVGSPVGITLEGNKLTAENADTTADSFEITVTAEETKNFNKPEPQTFTVKVVEKEDAEVKIDAPTTKTYGDADFTLKATTKAADNGIWSWTSSNEAILQIVSGANTAEPTIHVVKADATGATLTATYSSDAYYGTASVKITVAPKNVTGAMIGVIDSKEYNGGAIQPTPEVKDGETILAPGRDFEFGYSDNTNAGTATLTIEGIGNYTGTAEKQFTIEPKNIGSAIIVLGGLSRPYTGEEQTVEIVSVTLPDGDSVDLERDVDYTVKDHSNTATDAAKIVLTIEGKGNYTGTAAKTWEITRIEPKLADFDVVPDLSNELAYSGEEQTVNVTTKAGIRGMGMITVRYNGSTEKPVNAGSYAITIDVADGSNYKKISGIEAGTLTIKKAAAPTLADVKVNHAYATTGNQTVSLAELVKSAKSYAPGEITGNTETEILSDINVTGDGVLQYTLTGKGAAGSTVTIPVTIASTNYEETTVNVVITIKQATPTGAPGYDFVHDSSKTLKDAGLDLINSTLNPKEGTLEWIDSNGKVLPGETKLEEGKKYIWRFTPDDPNYAVITGEVELYAPYRILDGADSTWTQSTDGTIAIRGNGDFEKFQSVKVDGVVVDAKNYTVAKGSTIITFKGDYLKTLSTGSHTFELVWTDGSATTNFTIAAKPDNGDNNNSDNNNNDKNDDSDNDTVVIGNVSSGNNTVPAVIGAPKTGDASGIWMTLFAVSLAGLAAMLVRKKNNRE